MLAVQVASEIGNTLTGKDAEDSSLMFGKLCDFVSPLGLIVKFGVGEAVL